MRNTLTILFLGIGQIIVAGLYPHVTWLLLWSGLSFGIVGTAYALQNPSGISACRHWTMRPRIVRNSLKLFRKSLSGKDPFTFIVRWDMGVQH